MYEEKNAIIGSVRLGEDDHGSLTAWVHLDYGGSGQGFGGHCLYLPKDCRHHDKSHPAAGHFIWRVLEVAGAKDWRDLPGKTVRVRASHEGVEEIGHVIKNDWFNPKKDFLKLEQER